MIRNLAILLFLLPAILSAQTGDTTPPPPAAATAPPRANWYSDRRPIRVGDLITVYIDERVSSTERISTVARSDRSQDLGFEATFAPEDLRKIGTGINSRSNQTGSSDRRGNFTAALTVRVVEIEPGGILHISGSKQVSLEGRKQAITLTGVIRPDDVVAGNAVLSTRIAEAQIVYEGKKISPKSGIFGKILGLLWP